MGGLCDPYRGVFKAIQEGTRIYLRDERIDGEEWILPEAFIAGGQGEFEGSQGTLLKVTTKRGYRASNLWKNSGISVKCTQEQWPQKQAQALAGTGNSQAGRQRRRTTTFLVEGSCLKG